MQQKRLETRSRQKQPRFVKQRARQDLVHRHPALAVALPVASAQGSNGLPLEGAALTDESDSDSEEWWDDPKFDVLVTSGPPTPLHAPLEKLDFLGYFGLTTIDRRQYLELQRLLNGSDRMASALLEDSDDHLEQSANGLLLPLPTHPPEVVCGGTDYPSKVQFLRELELKTTTRREREDSETYWIACEGEKSRRGSNCKIAKYLLTYRESQKKRSKQNSVLASQRDFCKPVASRHVPSICDKLLGLSFSGMGVSASSPQSYLPLVRSALPCVLDVVLPAMLSQPNGEPPESDSESSAEDADNKEDEQWPGIEAIFSSYVNYHKRTNIELSVLRSHMSMLKEQVSQKNNEFNALEQRLKDLTLIKTSQDVERMRLQNCLDSLSSYLNGLKTNLRYKKPC
ncbi:uncharacterized protein LOC117648378 [Thrips palmi]|uniref:Uncharacterized protein LOC117648378 n=1 Tax=Thrips palmi TaxID=161013 RepID=A0A6P8Z8H7_THRPL|nr:uncharacterized protein LOC117648378 [Thrips palmi]